MSLANVWAQLLPRPTAPRRHKAHRTIAFPRRCFRPRIEILEDRIVLSGYQQLNLVGYLPGMAPHTDPNLNGWGMDFAPDGPFCVADTFRGAATFYDRSGDVLPQVVTIPAAPSHPLGPVGRPEGLVYNPTADFVISEDGRSAPAVFLFATRDGTISGWNPAVDPDHAIIMVDNSTEAHPANYTGLVIAQNSYGQNVLYAADFGRSNSNSNNRVDMFDGSFQSLGYFTDPNVAVQYPGYNAWQVEEVNGQLWVAFAIHTPPNGGVVDIFDTDGHLLTPNHFTANAGGAGPLENPWGIVQAPAHFGAFSNDILIGNVEGDGNINAFDPTTGAFLGPLRHPDGTPIAIPGLWDLTFGGGSHVNGRTNQLFFDAGPNLPDPPGNGLFGMIFAAGRGEGDDADGENAAGRAGPGNAPAGQESGEFPVQVVVGLSGANGLVATAVASYPGTAPPAASSRGNPIAPPQTTPAPAAESAWEGSDRQMIRTGRGEPHEEAVDRVFGQLGDGPDDALWSF
jgi:uncharacterized protein (TIGR03118 family)